LEHLGWVNQPGQRRGLIHVIDAKGGTKAGADEREAGGNQHDPDRVWDQAASRPGARAAGAIGLVHG